jgi:hypothetical protein
LSKIVKKNGQKVDKKLTKSGQKSCQKVQNSTNSGGWVGGEKVVPRPLASASLTGRRQKEVVGSDGNWLRNSRFR